MEPTSENIIAALKEQILQTQQVLDEAGYDPALVREQVADLAGKYGSPALDVGTGACACMAVMMAQKGMSVMAVDHASSAVRIAQEQAAGKIGDRLEIRHAEASRLPFADGSYRVVTAFDAVCHANDPVAVVKEMFRVSGQAVIITELNEAGRDVTRHLDGGFHNELPALLATHCNNCQQINSAHHVTYVCEKKQ